jgi:predicted nuclease of predicted toxin-antitoxin system
VKLLFDHNLSPRLVDRLVDLYPGSSHVFLLGLDRSPDDDVWRYAGTHGFIIVTKDSDFEDFSVLRGAPPKVVWIRRGNCATREIEMILREHHADVEALEGDASAGTLLLF